MLPDRRENNLANILRIAPCVSTTGKKTELGVLSGSESKTHVQVSVRGWNKPQLQRIEPTAQLDPGESDGGIPEAPSLDNMKGLFETRTRRPQKQMTILRGQKTNRKRFNIVN